MILPLMFDVVTCAIIVTHANITRKKVNNLFIDNDLILYKLLLFVSFSVLQIYLFCGSKIIF